MPTNTTAYDIADLVRLGIVVTSTSGARRDTGMTLLIHEPATPVLAARTTKVGPVTQPGSTATILRTTTGTWVKYFKVSRAGRHTWQWLSTGLVTLSTGGAFAVRNVYASTGA